MGVVTASQRCRAYNATVVFDVDAGEIVGVLASACECVVHLGPGCSHQLAIILQSLALAKLTNVEQLRKFPSPVRAVQRTAMTIEYAYGYSTINKLLKQVKLPHATREAEPPVLRARDTPEPLESFVEGVIAGWERRSIREDTPNQIRVKAIIANTRKVIQQYPREPGPQYLADLSRERLYRAYKDGIIEGWHADMPSLDLYYLVITRRHRLQRIEEYERLNSAPAARATRTVVVSRQQRLMSLYRKLPGRWTVAASAIGLEEDVRVVAYTDGKIFLCVGEYLNRTGEDDDDTFFLIEKGHYERTHHHHNRILTITLVCQVRGASR